MAIWKFVIDSTPGRLTLLMPQGAMVISAQAIGERAAIWALVHPEAPETARHFDIVPTGRIFDPSKRSFIATIQTPPYTWHLFEVMGS